MERSKLLLSISIISMVIFDTSICYPSSKVLLTIASRIYQGEFCATALPMVMNVVLKHLLSSIDFRVTHLLE